MLGFSYGNAGDVTQRDWLEPRPVQYPAEVHPQDAWLINYQVSQVSICKRVVTILQYYLKISKERNIKLFKWVRR